MQQNDFVNARNRLVAQKVIKNLQKRHMEGYYADTLEEAREIALSLIPEGSSVGWGGGFSADEIGLKAALKAGPYTCIDRDVSTDPAVRKEIMRRCFSADAFIMGTNAISEDGHLVNLDGSANRVAALCFGPDSVIVIAGMNKLVKDLDEAIIRTRNIAAPVNAQRFNIDTPCKKTGACGNCLNDDCICGQLVVTRHCMPAGRIKVILVNENLGF